MCCPIPEQAATAALKLSCVSQVRHEWACCLLQKQDGVDVGKLCKEGDFKLGDWLGDGEVSPVEYMKSKGVPEAALV